jgi:DNA-binding transcriptional LysR family regulator
MAGEPLASHDADIAVRLKRFEHHDVVARSIGTIAFGLYGCVAYLAQRGEPDVESGCPGHQLITLISDEETSAQSSWLAEHAGRSRVVLKADSYETQLWAAACGGGLALLPRFRADAEPALRRIRTLTQIPVAEIWLGVHRENRATPRIRMVLDCISDAARSRTALLNPSEPISTQA